MAKLDELIGRAIEGDPHETAFEFKRRGIPWGYLRKVAERVDALLSEAGLGEAAQIGFVPRNRPAFAAALLALLRARRTIIMVYAFQSQEAIANDLAKLKLPAVIADEQDWSETTTAALVQGALGVALASDVDAADPVRLVAGDPKVKAPGARGPSDEPLLEMLTSGTTGVPKRSPTTYATMESAIITGSVLDAGKDRDEKQRGFAGTVNFPISNISGLYSFLPMAVERRTMLFQEKFDLDLWLDFVGRYKPTVAVLPPAGVRMMLDRDLPADTLDGVRYIQVGTAALDLEAHRAFEERFDVAILLSYGATEFCGAATTMTAELYEKYGKEKFGSVGKPYGDNKVRIVDPDEGHELGPNEVGIMEVMIPALGDDYIHTTDLGICDEDGFFWHRGRVDGVIMRGGFKIMPRVVEERILALPGVAACAVVGVPDRRLGEVPVAMIEMLPGEASPSDEVIGQHIRARLPATNVPVAYHYFDSLPRTPSLKIDLAETRRMARELATA